MNPCRLASIEPEKDQATAASPTDARLPRVEWTPVVRSLLKEWLVLKIINKSSYVKLAVWLVTKTTSLIDCLDLAIELTDDELNIKVSDAEIKRAIAELEKVGFCRTERVVQLSLLDILND